MFKKTIIQLSIIAIIIGSVFIVNGLVLAWAPPVAAPPGSNVAAPLNVSGTAQTKTGALTASNLYASARHFYLGLVQDIYGDNSSAIYYDSNHDTVTQMLFRDKQNTTYGRVYGSGDGANFGLLDGDGNWSYLAVKDNYTQFRINNSAKMTIKSTGNVGIGTTAPGAKLEVDGNIIADTPIEDNHVATKAYVDAASGGCGGWAGYSAVHNGNFGGPRGMNNWCDTSYSGSHACAYDEIMKLGNSYPYSQECMIMDGEYWVGGDRSDSKVNIFFIGTRANNINRSGGDGVGLNCFSWTYSDSGWYMPRLTTSGRVSVDASYRCSALLPVACCH